MPKKQNPLLKRVLKSFCARNRTRTCTSVRILVPETSASTNSAIRADNVQENYPLYVSGGAKVRIISLIRKIFLIFQTSYRISRRFIALLVGRRRIIKCRSEIIGVGNQLPLCDRPDVSILQNIPGSTIITVSGRQCCKAVTVRCPNVRRFPVGGPGLFHRAT